jgi:hypothetical protein
MSEHPLQNSARVSTFFGWQSLTAPGLFFGRDERLCFNVQRQRPIIQLGTGILGARPGCKVTGATRR